jgi:Holliday junction DNA helicase RuvA
MIVDVNGVGYEVSLASTSLYTVGDSVELYIHTVVRPDALILYGFTSLDDRHLFETLLATPGVGPSTALGALRTLGASELAAAIEAGDVKRVGTIPGVGPKTASRIVLELKGKLVLHEESTKSAVAKPRHDIEDALKSWGYGSSEIRDALADIELPDDESAALKVALQRLRRS